ncbi:MAG: Nif3-like dinuclear metal center hexameric protein [Mycoplasmoidaceae bacterium]
MKSKKINLKIKDIDNILDKLYPYKNADIWDNVGLFRKVFKNKKVNKALIALDVSIGLINYAIKNNINLLITHHPILICKKDLKDKQIKIIIDKMKAHEISLISLHTNFDKSKSGMNYQLSKKLNCIISKKAFDNSYGNVFKLEKAINEGSLIKLIKSSLNCDYAITNNLKNINNIKTIYICGGSGSNEIEYLIKQNKKIDCYITGEIKWHLWNYATDLNIKLIDVGHSIENIFCETIKTKLKNEKIICEIFPKQKLILV